MKLVFLICFIVPGFVQPVCSQTGSRNDSVYAAVQDYLEACYERDSAKMIRSIAPDIINFGFYKEKGTEQYQKQYTSYPEMINYAVSIRDRNKQRPAGTIKKIEILDVLEQTASVKLTAWWGTDYILLAKINERWMLRMLLWQGPLIIQSIMNNK